MNAKAHGVVWKFRNNNTEKVVQKYLPNVGELSLLEVPPKIEEQCAFLCQRNREIMQNWIT